MTMFGHCRNCCHDCKFWLRCHTCCKCVPAAICVAVTSNTVGCSCDSESNQFVAVIDNGRLEYSGTVECGSLTVDLTFFLENNSCDFTLESTCLGLTGGSRPFITFPIGQCMWDDLEFEVTGAANCGDANCDSLTITVTPLLCGCCTDVYDCPDIPADPEDPIIEPENGWPLVLYGTLTAITANCACLDGKEITFNRVTCIAPDPPIYEGEVSHTCPQNPDPLRITLRCCPLSDCDSSFQAITNSCSGAYVSPCSGTNPGENSTCSPFHLSFDSLIVLGCCEVDPLNPNELMSMEVTE